MKKVIIVLACFCFGACNTFSQTELPSLQWNEKGLNAADSVTLGIPSFDGVVVNYEKSNKRILKVKLDDPVVVSVASKPEKWGFFQFPSIYRALNNSLVVSWNMADDAVKSYGHHQAAFAVSRDGGKTWNMPQGSAPVGGGEVLPDGDRIKVYTPAALDVDTLHLPDPVKRSLGRRGLNFYRLNQLPSSLQGVYLMRLAKGGTKWDSEHAILNDPRGIRYSEAGLFPVVWWGDMHVAKDGSVIAGIYPGFEIEDNNEVKASGVTFYRSADAGRSWNVQGRIPYEPDLSADPNGDKRTGFGFTEPTYLILSNGIFLCVMRTSDGLGISPMYLSYSNDQGVTWSKPKPFTRNGVLPRLLQLDNGVIVLASGRPGVQLRFSEDSRGDQWTDPFEMLPYKNAKETVSCGYTGLLATGKNSFLIVYSDFKYPDKEGELRKAIKVREVVVTPNR
jgi:hypothetical protein